MKKGDAVRITKPKQIFDKAYFPSRSDYIYKIEESTSTKPVHYKLIDDSGDKLKQRFYQPELVKTVKDDETSYRVEKVIRSRKKNGRKEILVKFIDYPGHYWINQEEIVN